MSTTRTMLRLLAALLSQVLLLGRSWATAVFRRRRAGDVVDDPGRTLPGRHRQSRANRDLAT